MKMKFRTQISDHVRFHAPSPEGIAYQYTEKFLPNGKRVLERSGKADLNEFVQVSARGTTLKELLQRFRETQDLSVLDVVRGFSADVVGLPHDLMEAQNLMISIQKRFDSLPADLRQKFNNSPNEFAVAYMNGQVEQKLGVAAAADFVQNNEKVGENNNGESSAE